MKKIICFVIALIGGFFAFSRNINATNYSGTLGYEYLTSTTNFYFLVQDENVEKIYLHLEGKDPSEMILDDSGIYYYSASGDNNGKEYYYEICYLDSSCVNVIDNFSKTLNTTRDKNVVFDRDNVSILDWDKIVTISSKDVNKSIYVIDADKFTAGIENSTDEEGRTMDSVFEKLYTSATLSGQKIGYEYLENSGFNYLEISDLYDENNYFSPNVNFASGSNNESIIKELKEVVSNYKRIKINIIAKTNFMTPNAYMKANLTSMSSNYISDNKINLSDEMMAKYIKDVYKYWVSEHKVDGFYIEDSALYDKQFLTQLISELKELNPNIFIYTKDATLTGYYTDDNLQEMLIGKLTDKNNEGISNGNYDESSIKELVNQMFSGYYADLSKYNEASKRINNFGSEEGLDVYSKIILISGLGSSEETVYNKINLALYTIHASIGIPRVIAGNEFLNTSRVASELIDSTSDDLMICNNSKTLCYGIKENKSINWEYLVRNGSKVQYMHNYRTRYTYQYPSISTLTTAKEVKANYDYADKGLLYLVFDYGGYSNGEVENSIFLINYSGEAVAIDDISSKEYSNNYALLGGISREDGKSIVSAYTFFTFTEVINKKLPGWAYFLIAVALVLIIFGIRFLLIKMLKQKRGIDYSQYSKEQRILRKKNKKEKIREKSVFETYLFDEPLLKKKNKNTNKESNDNVERGENDEKGE